MPTSTLTDRSLAPRPAPLAPRSARWRPFVLLAVTHPFWLGCSEDAGPSLYLSDASQGCASRETDTLDRPVALGARLDLRARLGDDDVTVTGVTLSDGTIFSVEALTNPVGLRALAEGSTSVTVKDDMGYSGTAELDVEPIDSAAITVDAITVYNFDRYLETPEPCGPKSLTKNGYGLLPDGWLGLEITYRGAGGTELLGYDVAGWAAKPAVVSFAPSGDLTDAVRVSPAAGAGAGEVVVATVGSGHFSVTLLPQDEALTGLVYVPEHGQTRAALEMAVGEVLTVVLVLQDTAGRFVRGDAGVPFESQVSSGGAVVLRDPPWAKPEGELELDDEARAILRAARVSTLEAKAVGSAEVTLQAAGLSVKLPVTVK